MQSVKLNDIQMQQYLHDGYLLLETSLDQEFHNTLFRKTKEMFEAEGNPGNNLLPRLPEVGKIFKDQVVSGALSSILGDDYFMEPHRHCHYNAPGSEGQKLHKDSSERRHRTRRVFAFYYPQDTTEDMGPTSIVPRSHYYNTLAGAMEDSQEMLITVKAGAVIIANYDIWHRGTANTSDRPRYMMKFLFVRMSEPSLPTWNTDPSELPAGYANNHAMGKSMWDWYKGTPSQITPNESVSDLVDTVLENSEPAAIDAAYKLGSTQCPSIIELVELLKDLSGSYWWEQRSGFYSYRGKRVKRISANKLSRPGRGQGITSPSANAGYGLPAAGKASVPALIDLAENDKWWLRATVAEILGDIGPAASESIPALNKLAQDKWTSVRAETIHALGTVGQTGSAAVSTLAEALADDEDSVRQAASMALARTGPNAEEAVPNLVSALEDSDRYVRGNSAHALYRINSPQSTSALLDYLLASRWCYSTTKDSTY